METGVFLMKPMFYKRSLSFLNVFGGVACAAVFLVLPSFAGGENTPRAYGTLTPEAAALVAEMREQAKAYRPQTDHVGLFARAQLKYGAQRTDFLHRWYERPLHQNSTWAETAEYGRILHPEAWKKTTETVRLGKMDGLAVCISQSSRSEVIEKSVMPGGEMTILVELPYDYHDTGIAAFLETAERALAMPNAYRIDGKVVLTRYPVVKEAELDLCEKVRKALTEKFGPDKFIVIFYVSAFERSLPAGPMTVQSLEQAREHLRRCLRKMDGLFMAGWEVYWPRRYNAAFEREVLVPLYQSVLAEPEFAGKKYLGMPMSPGHENCYRWSYSIDSQGTYTLAERMETMRALRPDFIICCEWDEENENTHFRPTIFNGFVHQRLLRYYANVFAGRAPEVFPGDDVAIPNLVVSYRKSLIAGEPIEVEVRNIPDGTFKGQTFTCSLNWTDLAGKVVKTYPVATLKADEPGCAFFTSPVSELVVANRLLVPDFTVRASDGAEFRGGADFWPLDLNASRAVDTKWAKHALRERSNGITGELAVGEPAADGVRTITGRFSAPQPVKSVEVLEGPDTVFMFDPTAKPIDNRVVIKLEIQARHNAPKEYALKGNIRFQQAPGVEILTRPQRAITATADGWTLKGAHYNNWDINLFASLPAAAVETAEIDVALAPTFQTRIKVKDVVAKDVIGITGPGGGNLVASRYLSQIAMPKPCNVASGTFAFKLKPVDKSGVLRLQIVDSDGHVWRGAPRTFYRPSGKMRTFHIFERDEERVTSLTMDVNRLDEPDYDFVLTRGSVVWTDAGRNLCGILGGAATLVTGFGEGETCYGDSIARYITGKEPGILNTAPTPAEGPHGGPALRFGPSSYLMLPQQLVPKFAGFEITLDVKPDDAQGVQTLVDSGNAAYGLYLRDGVPEAFVFDTSNHARQRGANPRRVKGPALQVGGWNHVQLIGDQKTLRLVVNGVEGPVVEHGGYQLQARYTCVGAANRGPNFFRGCLANLKFYLR